MTAKRLLGSSAGPARPEETLVRRANDLLLHWYATERRDLLWRGKPDAYLTLVSEFMLQQTQVDRVVPYLQRFLASFPTIHALANAAKSDVLRLWSGLGYNSRALRLQEVARRVVEDYGGTIPDDPAILQSLPGIGPYTASAIACFAYGHQVATVDTNVRRVLGRVLLGTDALPLGAAQSLAQLALPQGRAADWNQALMDLSAAICKATVPRCTQCPLKELCQRYLSELAAPGMQLPVASAPPPRLKGQRNQDFAQSSRNYRGKVVQQLALLPIGEHLSLDTLSLQLREVIAQYDATRLPSVIDDLARDGLISLQEGEGGPSASLPE